MYFPVSSSIVSAQALTMFLQQQYNLPQGTKITLVKAGVNHTYKVSTGSEDYIFRIYSLDWRTKTEISEEIRLLNLLQNNGIAISVALKDVSGNYIQEIPAPEGLRYAALFSIAPGDKVHNFSEEIHHTMGTLMGNMHKVTHNLPLQRVAYTPELLLEDSLEKIGRIVQPSEELSYLHSIQQPLLQELRNADTANLRKGAVHLDIWFDNIAITDKGEITIFDFDFCGNGWLCLDLAYYILQVRNTEKDEAICNSKIESFLKGYESVTPLTTEEKRLIPILGTVLHFFYLGVQCSRYENWSSSFLNELYFKRYIMILVKPYYEKYGGAAKIDVI